MSIQVLAPDLLEEVRQLPLFVIGGAAAIGLFLWLLGGRFHHFWLALALTLSAGTFGLIYGKAYGTQPLVAGDLMAVSMGVLALSLVRVLLFGAGGLLGVALMRAAVPEWNEPLVSFVSGGLAGVLLYRLWVVVLSSLVGTVLLAYSVLGALDRLGKLDSPTWAQKNGPLLGWALAGATLTGMLAQFLLSRYLRRRKQAAEEKKKAKAKEKEKEKAKPKPPPEPEPAAPWWQGYLPDVFNKKAG